MNVQIYSLKELPRDLCLAKDPYVDVETRKKLASLGVVFWRDELHSKGVILNSTLDYPVDMFYSQLVMTNDGIVGLWPTSSKEEETKLKEKNGDLRMWLVYNKCVVIEDMQLGFVRFH